MASTFKPNGSLSSTDEKQRKDELQKLKKGKKKKKERKKDKDKDQPAPSLANTFVIGTNTLSYLNKYIKQF